MTKKYSASYRIYRPTYLELIYRNMNWQTEDKWLIHGLKQHKDKPITKLETHLHNILVGKRPW